MAALARSAAGETPRPQPAELTLVAAFPVAVLAATAGLWPLWHRAPALAGTTTLVVTALVTTGAVLLADRAQRPVGARLVLGGALLELSWCNEWGGGPLPALSLLEGHAWLFLVGWGLYRYPGPRLAPRERRAFRVITGWVLAWPWALILTSRPGWRGYPADAWWPALWPDRTAHAIATWAVDLTAVGALGVYVGLWLQRIRATPANRRRPLLPAAFAAVIGASCAALVPLADVGRLPLPVVDLLDTVATVGVLAIPAALLLAVADRQRADLLTASASALTAERSARRRIEQDLHDGAQARFLALAPLIGAAQARTDDPATCAALDEIRAQLQGALRELRRLVHGTDGPDGAASLPAGDLAAAVRDLVTGCAVPVHVDLPAQHVPAGVESAAYLVICEAVSNALKHAQALTIAVEGRIEGGVLTVSVRDDGCGGAAPSRPAAGDPAPGDPAAGDPAARRAVSSGRGVPGMAERARALGGRLDVVSPPAGGTTVTLELPCG